jgi:gamma-glutamylcyclotransferase (GGCT)/AIG2-like uncharacterized protein YtfP
MQNKEQLVAVYGSLRKSLHNHSLLAGSEYIGEYITEPIYDMYSVSGSYPGLVQHGSTSIHMEVYSVTDVVATNLDRLEGYKVGQEDSNHYNKVTVNTPFGKASLYIYNHSVKSMVKVESGNWVSFKEYVKTLMY